MLGRDSTVGERNGQNGRLCCCCCCEGRREKKTWKAYISLQLRTFWMFFISKKRGLWLLHCYRKQMQRAEGTCTFVDSHASYLCLNTSTRNSNTKCIRSTLTGVDIRVTRSLRLMEGNRAEKPHRLPDVIYHWPSHLHRLSLTGWAEKHLPQLASATHHCAVRMTGTHWFKGLQCRYAYCLCVYKKLEYDITKRIPFFF